MPEPHLSDHEQAVLWRRHYECLDSLVHAFTGAELDRVRNEVDGAFA